MNRSFSVRAFVVSACLLGSTIVSGPVWAQQQQRRQQPMQRPLDIRGRVLPAPGETELPMMVRITIREMGSAYESTQMALSGGRFEFRNVPYANYELFVSADGYQTWRTEIYEKDSPGGVLNLTLNVGQRLAPGNLTAGGGAVSVASLNVPKDALREAQKASEEEKKGKHEKALEHLQKAVEIYPEFSAAYTNMGAIYSKMGSREEAERAFSRAIEVDSANGLAYKNLGYLYLTTKREAEAVEPLKKAAELAPSDPNTQAFLGEALYQAGNYAEAEAPLKKALELAPENFRASYRLGYTYVQLKRYPEALEQFQAFLKNNQGMETSKVESVVKQLEAAIQK